MPSHAAWPDCRVDRSCFSSFACARFRLVLAGGRSALEPQSRRCPWRRALAREGAPARVHLEVPLGKFCGSQICHARGRAGATRVGAEELFDAKHICCV